MDYRTKNLGQICKSNFNMQNDNMHLNIPKLDYFLFYQCTSAQVSSEISYRVQFLQSIPHERTRHLARYPTGAISLYRPRFTHPPTRLSVRARRRISSTLPQVRSRFLSVNVTAPLFLNRRVFRFRSVRFGESVRRHTPVVNSLSVECRRIAWLLLKTSSWKSPSCGPKWEQCNVPYTQLTSKMGLVNGRKINPRF